MEGSESILLVQQRFHTNQYPIVKAFLNNGHDVHFLAHRRSNQEVYDVLEPDIIKLSPLFKFVYSVIRPFFSMDVRYRFAFPSMRWYFRYLESVDPDLIIVKHYVTTSLVTMLMARIIDADVVFYDQEPVYGQSVFYFKRYIASAIYYFLHGERFVRISPVLGAQDGELSFPRSYYVPFVADPDVRVTGRTYCQNDHIRVMMVGKLHHKRKEHILLLRAINALSDQYQVNLTLIGTLTDPDNDYYQQILGFIKDHGLDDIVEVKSNLSYHEVQEEYRNHDVYVLPSRDEPGAVSPLEAMNSGLPVVCSDTCGTRCYIEEGMNGYIFKTGDVDDLLEKLEAIVSSEETIREFGKRSLELAQAEHSVDRYYDRISCIIEENFS